VLIGFASGIIIWGRLFDSDCTDIAPPFHIYAQEAREFVGLWIICAIERRIPSTRN